ncbi:MAG: redoxin domain-containing protein [Actinobacteria bacterium]|nr:redoxin domain-containing protein [Actinomycetota bacterium]
MYPSQRIVGRIGMVVAIVAVAGIGFTLIKMLNGNGPAGSEKLIGYELPQFAAPLASSGLDLDANVVSREAAVRGNANAACEVRVKGAFVSCRDLTGNAVITFWRRDKPVCVRQVDEMQRAFATDKSVHVAALAFKEPVKSVAQTAREHGWTIPVVVDRDAAAAELFLVSGCPSTYFARDGRITGVKLGLLDTAALRRAVAAKPDPKAKTGG